MSGKSGGRVGGLTGGGSGWGLSSSGLGMALVLEDVRLTRVDPCLFRWASKHGQRGWHLPRPEDTARNAGIAGMLRSGMSWTAIQAAACCSRATIAKVAKRAA
jgi:hypothetical protein